MEGLCCVCECGGSGNKLILFFIPIHGNTVKQGCQLGYCTIYETKLVLSICLEAATKASTMGYQSSMWLLTSFYPRSAVRLCNIANKSYWIHEALYISEFSGELILHNEKLLQWYPFLVFPCRFCHRVVFMKQVTNTLLLSTTVRR